MVHVFVGGHAAQTSERVWSCSVETSLLMTLIIAAMCGVTLLSVVALAQSQDATICSNPAYSSATLKLAHEEAFAALIKNTKKQHKFETSDVVLVNDDFYAICDSSWAIDKIGASMAPFASSNTLIGTPDRESNDSEYEALFYDYNLNVFNAVREAVVVFPVDNPAGEYHSLVEELRVDSTGRGYSIERTCVTELKFDSDSKGLEGAVGLRDATGELYMLGLCEGNHCKDGTVGRDSGNGQAILMRRSLNESLAGYTCVWKTVRTLHIPAEASFQDYSAISISNSGRVAITSQENSQVWLGWLSHWTPAPNPDVSEEGWEQSNSGTFDPLYSEFVAAPPAEKLSLRGAAGKQLVESHAARGVLNFPRDDNCNVQYCNIEGVHWLNDDLLVTVSDQMKDGGEQNFRCLSKDQSIHVFAIPRQG
jgi:hypothetical protein